MEMTQHPAGEPEDGVLLPAMMELYCSALRGMGQSAVQACPTVGSDLEQELARIENRLANDPTIECMKQTEPQVADGLNKWGTRTAEHFQTKSNEVKELLIVLAKTAESVGARDQRYTAQFNDLTTRLKAIANLDDLTQIRASLMQRATELKNCVDQMERDSQESVAQLRAEVSTYQTKLKAVEHLALKDTLTGLANRRSIEARMEWLLLQNETFCVVMLDLNGFKQINDTHGHAAGDHLLVQFAKELETNIRSADMAGRWGGDEFIAVLTCDLAGAKSHLDRIQKWVFGKYTIQAGGTKDTRDVEVSAAVGLAQWRTGITMQDVIKEADAAMYKDKQATSKQRP